MAENFSPLDVNKADRDDLINLPGVGAALADRIIHARPFESLEDLQRVEGVGPVLLKRFEPLLRFPEPQKEDIIAPDELDEGEGIDVGDQTMPEALEQDYIHDEQLESDGETEERTEEPLVEDALAADETEPLEDDLQFESNRIEDGDLDIPVSAASVMEIEESQIEKEVADAPLEDDQLPEDEDQRPVEKGHLVAEEVNLVASQPEGVTRGEVFMSAAGCSVIALVLAIVLTLGILAGINGGLTYIRPTTLIRLSGELDSVDDQIDSLKKDIEDLQINLVGIEDTIERVEILEGEFEQLHTDLEAVTIDIDELSSQINDVDDELTKLQARTIVFREFLDGLRELVEGLEYP